MRRIFLLLLVLICVQTMYAQTPVGGVNAVNKETLEKRISDKLIGTWTLVWVENILHDSTRTKPYGENP